MSQFERSKLRATRHFIRDFGRQRFHHLLEMLHDDASGLSIATEFNVSRERVRQWRQIFAPVAKELLAPGNPPQKHPSNLHQG